MALSGAEARRKLLHMAVGGFALLLRWLTWPQAAAMAVLAFLFNWLLLPRLGGRALWRAHEHSAGYTLGMLLYPLSVLALILFFRHDLALAAAAWALLAYGDGMAGFVGQALGGPRLPWNRTKGWSGLLAFVACGTLAATLLAGWTQGLGAAALAASLVTPGIVLPFLLVAVACALVEAMPTTLDDNLTVPLTAAAGLALVSLAQPHLLLADAEAPQRLLWGLSVNAVVAYLAYRAGSIDIPGALSASVIGTLITLGTGLHGFAVMATFFVLGSTVTRLGYSQKAARGIAQERGGRRGWRNAWANGGVPALLACLAAMTSGDVRALCVLAYVASVATAAADTCSSEIGKAYGRRTFLITTLRPVPPGTEGAISVEGTLGGLLGAAVVALVGALGGLYAWSFAPLVALAGLLGSLAESVIGTLAERRGWLDNDQLNALNTAIGGGLAAWIARVWLPVVGQP